MTETITPPLTVRPDCWARVIRSKVSPVHGDRQRVALLLARDAVRVPAPGIDLGEVGIPEGTWRRLRMPEPSFYRHLAVLVADGYLVHLRQGGKYRPARYRLALPTLAQETRPRPILVVTRVTVPDTPAALLTPVPSAA